MTTRRDTRQATSSGELCEYITSGSRDWRSYYSDSGPLFIRTQDINQDRLDLSEVAHVSLPDKVEGKRSRVQPGDLLVIITGANVGKVALVPDGVPEAYVSQSVGLMRLKDKRIGPYLHYYLQSDRTGRKHVLDMVYGIGRPVLSLKNLREIPVSLPSLDEQQRIVVDIEKQFTRLDAGVSSLRRVQIALKRYRASVLKAACEGRLVPTESELARKENRSYETGEQLLQRILKDRREKWNGKGKYKEPAAPRDEVLPSLPSGWALASFDQLTENFDGRRVPLKAEDRDKRSGPYPYYGASGVIDDIDDFLFDGEFLLIGEDGANLLARSSPIAFQASGRFWVNNHAHVVQSRGGVSLSYLETYLNGKDLKFYVTGSAQPKLTQASMNKLPVPLPPVLEQTRIVEEVQRRLTIAEEVESSIAAAVQRASRLQASILHESFSPASYVSGT